MGTGFGVRSDGWIATSLHVVAGADAVGITKHDGTKRRVTAVRAYDVERDLAVLEAPGDIAILPIAETMGLDVGAPVVAIGNPMGLTGTVSSGLVSGVREIEPSFTVLQISAPIAPGSSGGPILDDHGRVVGVAMATVVDGQNLNFAVPSTYLVKLLGASRPTSMAEFASKTAHIPARRSLASSPGR